MIERYAEGISWLEFELLADCGLVHGCFNRHGGVSTGSFESLNLGWMCPDDPKKVAENRKKVMNVLHLQHMVFVHGEHGDKTISVDALTDKQMPKADGLATSVKGQGLCVTQADCQGCILYDPLKRALANVHCGWRGNVQNIYGKAVEHLQRRYGCNPENILACISPSLGPESAEFVNCRDEFSPAFFDFQGKPNFFDLWAVGQWQLLNAGILPHHIQIAAVDTYVDDDYFSYRRNKDCGRQVTVAAIA